MTEEFNPYAAPQTESAVLPAADTEKPTVWRDGRLVIIPHGADLPDRCWKCNAPAHGQRLRRQLSWHHPGYFLVVLLGLLPYLIVALLVSRKAKFSLGICEHHFGRRRQNLGIAWGLALTVLGMMIGPAIVVTNARTSLVPFYVGGLLLLLVGIIYGIAFANLASARRIDKHTAWVTGAGREFLDSLPDAIGQTVGAA